MTAFERLVLSLFYLAPWKDLSVSRRYETLEKRGYREKGGDIGKGKARLNQNLKTSQTAGEPEMKDGSKIPRMVARIAGDRFSSCDFVILPPKQVTILSAHQTLRPNV